MTIYTIKMVLTSELNRINLIYTPSYIMFSLIELTYVAQTRVPMSDTGTCPSVRLDYFLEFFLFF